MDQARPGDGVQLTGADVNTRVVALTHDSDLSWVAGALTARRDAILDNWLAVATQQGFHQARPGQVVADHVPALLDALIGLLRRSAPRWIDSMAPLDDSAVVSAAREHARMRAQQGLEPGNVLVEFRLLRQEIWRALRENLDDAAPNRDVLAAQLLVNDALDGAITLGLVALTEAIADAREEFLATTVHEVRHPITVIKTSAQVARRALAGPEPDLERARRQHAHIETAADRLADLLAVLADASRAALGHLELERSEVDLVALLRERIGQLPAADARRVHLEVAPNVEARGWWDAERLRQVFDNLLSNALKYSPDGAPIEARARVEAGVIAVSVRDQGIGVAADELPLLFERYGRARRARAQGIEGLGLGLYLARRILEAHGGSIRAESPGVGQGTTMHVVLPLA